MVESDEASHILTKVSEAIDATLARPEFSGVYASPWWEIESVDSASFGWKRAILRRRAEGGADHWGHLFLTIGPAGSPPALSSERSGPRGPSYGALRAIEIPSSVLSVRLLVRASHDERARDLEQFAERVAAAAAD